MAAAKKKAFLVTCEPPKGVKPELKNETREGETRTIIRSYYLMAENRAEAQSIAEATERLAVEQRFQAWKDLELAAGSSPDDLPDSSDEKVWAVISVEAS